MIELKRTATTNTIRVVGDDRGAVIRELKALDDMNMLIVGGALERLMRELVPVVR
jgi:hypothetical protein